MKVNILFVVLSMTVVWSCKGKSKLDSLQWLQGTWENKTNDGNIYETWVQEDALHFAGKSYMLQGSDTIVFETVNLLEEQNNLFYIPTVKGQNNEQPVRFTLKSLADNKMVFENPAHDFPQVITYQKINADSLVASVSGKDKGVEREEVFGMRRVR